MTHKRKTARCTMASKSAYTNDDGMFVEGYGSIFGNVDSHGDVVVKGAFAETINPEYREANQLPPIRFIRQHDMDGDPIGVFVEIEETDKGLWFKAKIDDTAVGRDAYNQFESGSRDSFSIGFRTLDDESISIDEAAERGYRTDGFMGDAVNVIHKIELFEISAVLFAANTSARMGVKSMFGRLKTKAAAGEFVQFYDDEDLLTAEVLEVITDAVELDDGVIEPDEDDPILKVEIVEEDEEGAFVGTGEIVYIMQSWTIQSEATDAVEEIVEDEGPKRIGRIGRAKQAPKRQAAPSRQRPLVKSGDVSGALSGLSSKMDQVLSAQSESHRRELNALKEEVNKMKSANRPSARVQSARPVRKSVFDQFKESDGVRDSLKRGRYTAAQIEVKGSLGGISSKADPSIVRLGGTEGLASQNIDRRGIIEQPEDAPMLRDLMKVIATQHQIISYIEETGAATAVTEIAAAVASNATTITVEDITSFYEGQEIWIEDDGNQKREKAVIKSINVETRVITLDAPLKENHDAGVVVSALTFKFTPETQVKPALNLGFKEKQVEVKTLAHWVPVTKQALDDIDMLRTYIDGRLIAGLKRTEERQILFGQGGTQELEGIASNPDVRDLKWSDGANCDTKLDTIRRAVTLCSYSGLMPDVGVVSVADWQDMELAKGVDGHYIYADVVNGTEHRRWGLRIFVSNAVQAGTCIVGAFREGATLWDRESINIAITDSHADYFVRNMYAIRGEERIGLSVEFPQAFVIVDFDEAPECPCCAPVAPVDPVDPEGL